MKTLTTAKAQKDLVEIIAEVCAKKESIVLRTPAGLKVKLIPMLKAPKTVKASKTWRGRPLFTEADIRKMNSPYPNEPKWE